MKILYHIVLTMCLIVYAHSQAIPKGEFRPYYPKSPSSRQSLFCSLGDTSLAGCEPISAATLNDLNSCTELVNIQGDANQIGFLLLNQYADTTFFQELANRSVIATDCQLQILQPSGQAQLTESAWQVYSTLQPLLKVLTDRKTELGKVFESQGLAAADHRTGHLAQAERIRIQGQMDSLNSSIDGLLAQIPFGALPATQDAFRLVTGRTLNKAEFTRIYNSTLNANIEDLKAGQKTLADIRDPETGYYDLSVSQKIEFYNSAGAQSLIARLDPMRRSLGCRFDNCYKDGPRNTQIAAMAAIIGVSVVSMGTSAPFLAAASTVGSLSFSARQVDNACFKDTLAITTETLTSCSPEAIAKTTISKVNSLQCATEIALRAFDVVGLGIEGARMARLLRRNGGVGPKTDFTNIHSPQMEIWKRNASANFRDAQELQRSVHRTLLEGEISSVVPLSGGRGGTKLVRFDNGLQGVWKPYGSVGNKELAAFELDQILGTNFVPVIVERNMNGARGTMQTYVTNPDPRPFMFGNPEELLFFDELLLNVDRNGGNFLIIENRTVAIDHGQTFGVTKSQGRFNRAVQQILAGSNREAATQQLQGILPSAGVLAALRKASPSELSRRLAPYLDETQIQGVIDRRQSVLETVDLAIERLGSAVIRQDGPTRPPKMNDRFFLFD